MIRLTPRQIAYQRYLRSDHWKKLREERFRLDEWKCQNCLTQDNLIVHHRFYRDRFKDSTVLDLSTLCRSCHDKEHGIERDSRGNVIRMHQVNSRKMYHPKLRKKRKRGWRNRRGNARESWLRKKDRLGWSF